MKTIGYAIVGTGYFGAELGRIMQEQEGAKIAAVLDPENGQSAADELGCDVTLVAIEGADHADRQFFQQEIWQRIAEFFHEKLG